MFQKLQRVHDSPKEKALRFSHLSIQQVLDMSRYSSDSEVDTKSFLNEFPLSNSSGHEQPSLIFHEVSTSISAAFSNLLNRHPIKFSSNRRLLKSSQTA